jgi:hypothetical protein
MNKIRCYLAAFALLATLSGPALLGMVSGSVANAASNLHASSVSFSFVAGTLTRSVDIKLYPPCPSPGASDC